MNYEDLLMEAEAEGLIVKEKPLKVSDGRIKGKRIAIRQDIPTYRQKSCVLAEELGHHHTTVGRIIEQDSGIESRNAWRVCGLTISASDFLASFRATESIAATSTNWQSAWKCQRIF